LGSNPYEAQTLLGVNTDGIKLSFKHSPSQMFLRLVILISYSGSGVLQIFAQDFSDNVHLKA
jgi:hypothetical protein